MSEWTKTFVFGGVALILMLVAFLTQPSTAVPDTPDIVGDMLFDKFDDPQKATSLKITKFDEEIGELVEFEVARNKSGRWVIPSHSSYPADAEQQMRNAALSMIDLEVLGVASEVDSDLAGIVMI